MLITNPFRKITTERGGGGRGANGRYFRRERVINTREGTQGKEGRCLLHAMSRSHHAFRCRVCTLHYLTSSSSSSENGRREKLERTAAARRRRCRKARSQFRNQIGPPNDRLFVRPSVLRGNVARHVSKREWEREEGRRERGRGRGWERRFYSETEVTTTKTTSNLVITTTAMSLKV